MTPISYHSSNLSLSLIALFPQLFCAFSDKAYNSAIDTMGNSFMDNLFKKVKKPLYYPNETLSQLAKFECQHFEFKKTPKVTSKNTDDGTSW